MSNRILQFLNWFYPCLIFIIISFHSGAPGHDTKLVSLLDGQDSEEVNGERRERKKILKELKAILFWILDHFLAALGIL